MADLLKFLAYIINGIHDFIENLARAININVSDKELHFWVIGGLGLAVFLITDSIFKKISRWNISVISFIYTLTVLLVFVFGLEIEQKITGRGNMEFEDIIYGLWGFIALFVVCLCVKIFIYMTNKYIFKRK